MQQSRRMLRLAGLLGAPEESRQGRGMPDEVSSRVIGMEICRGLLESSSRSLLAGSS
jgi:hypothetical protein